MKYMTDLDTLQATHHAKYDFDPPVCHCFWCLSSFFPSFFPFFFRLDALAKALSVIRRRGWVAGWLGGCLSQPVLYQND